jgi:N utilization substance protein B
MGKRREGREAAVQFLFQLDLNAERLPGDVETFWNLRNGPGKAPPPTKTRAFTEKLIQGVTANLQEVDDWIRKFATNYDVDRLAVVDRNVLRVAVYEMLHSPEVAPVIIIDEAIEVAKKFGSDKSGGFVNGILDRIKKEIGRPDRVAAPAVKS